jgi:hypothetical protein
MFPIPPIGLSFSVVKDFLHLQSTRKGRILTSIAWDWIEKYHKTQNSVRTLEKYCVEMDRDKQIPFKPEDAQAYVLIIPQFFSLARHFSIACDEEELQNITDCFKYANSLAASVFKEVPTFMPRPKEHNDKSLKFAQYFDDPTNCCPSLHITYSILAYNIGRTILPPNEFQDYEDSIGAMFSSVLYTKQHAVVDIVYGMVCAANSFQKQFPDQSFDDLTARFHSLQRTYPEVPFSEIETHYKTEISSGLNLFTLVEKEIVQSGRYKKLTAEECKRLIS